MHTVEFTKHSSKRCLFRQFSWNCFDYSSTLL